MRDALRSMEGNGFPPVSLENFRMFSEGPRPRLEAKKQSLSTLRYDLVETSNAFIASLALPGFDAEEIEIVALVNSILVRAESQTAPNHQALFRRILLPAKIDVTGVMASLEEGTLRISAPKATSGTPRSGLASSKVVVASGQPTWAE